MKIFGWTIKRVSKKSQCNVCEKFFKDEELKEIAFKHPDGDIVRTACIPCAAKIHQMVEQAKKMSDEINEDDIDD